MKVVLMVLGIVIVVLVVGISVRAVKTHHQSALKTTTTQADTSGIRYLPLGDSYTIGQSVAANERWPNQLVARLKSDNIDMQIVDNPSVTGYTTQDLINTELPLVPKFKPQFVSLLIGVNDYVQGVPIQTFTQHLDFIITTLQKELPHPNEILLVTIPDYGKTPTGAEFGNPATSEAGIIAFNNVIKQVGVTYKLPVADIFPISQQVANDPGLIASDGLHPSGKEYAQWTNVIFQTLKQAQIL
jgi:acyl-CoA thioesterase-1